MTNGTFKFDGDAGSYLGVSIAAFFIMALTVFLGTPWALTMKQQWIAKHTTIDGRRLKFSGTGAELFGNFIIWWVLCIVTIGIYSFWVGPKFQKFITENTEFA